MPPCTRRPTGTTASRSGRARWPTDLHVRAGAGAIAGLRNCACEDATQPLRILRMLGIQPAPIESQAVRLVHDALGLPIDEGGPLSGIEQDDAPGQRIEQLERPRRWPRMLFEPQPQSRGAAKVWHHALEEHHVVSAERLSVAWAQERQGHHSRWRQVHGTRAHSAEIVRIEKLINQCRAPNRSRVSEHFPGEHRARSHQPSRQRALDVDVLVVIVRRVGAEDALIENMQMPRLCARRRGREVDVR
jgi:hypothetical protein